MNPIIGRTHERGDGMVKRIFTVSFLLAIFCGAASAGGRNFGVGIILGEPTALSAKYWTSSTTAFDFGIGWGAGRGWNRYGVGYTDDRCYDNGYYNSHPGYCDARSYDNGGSGYGYSGLHLHADYLYHNFNLFHARDKVPLYYGPGISFNTWQRYDPNFGIRGVIGVAWMPNNAPIDIFFELAPVLELFPGIYPDVNAGLGARFYF